MNPLHTAIRSASTAILDDPALDSDPLLEPTLHAIADRAQVKFFEVQAAWDDWSEELVLDRRNPYWVDGHGRIRKHGRAARPRPPAN